MGWGVGGERGGDLWLICKIENFLVKKKGKNKIRKKCGGEYDMWHVIKEREVSRKVVKNLEIMVSGDTNHQGRQEWLF